MQQSFIAIFEIASKSFILSAGVSSRYLSCCCEPFLRSSAFLTLAHLRLRMTVFREVLHSRRGYWRESSTVVDFVLLSSFSLSQSGSSFSFSKCIPAFGDAAAVASKRNLCLLLRIHELEEFEESVELVLLLPLIQNAAAFLAFHHRLDQAAAVLVGCSTCLRKRTQNDFLILPINLCGGC